MVWHQDATGHEVVRAAPKARKTAYIEVAPAS